jgi:hypothetical protein
VEGEGGVVGEFEVVAAGVAADDPALLQGDDGLWVEVPVALGEGAWSAGDDVEDSGCVGAQGGRRRRRRSPPGALSFLLTPGTVIRLSFYIQAANEMTTFRRDLPECGGETVPGFAVRG